MSCPAPSWFVAPACLRGSAVVGQFERCRSRSGQRSLREVFGPASYFKLHAVVVAKVDGAHLTKVLDVAYSDA